MVVLRPNSRFVTSRLDNMESPSCNASNFEGISPDMFAWVILWSFALTGLPSGLPSSFSWKMEKCLLPWHM